MTHSNLKVAKHIILCYLENLVNKDMMYFEAFQELIAIKSDETNKILLEHMKAIKSIMESAIKELESKGK